MARPRPIKIPVKEQGPFQALKEKMETLVKAKNLTEPDQIYQTHYDLLLSHLNLLPALHPQTKTVLKMMKYNVLYWLLTEANQSHFNTMSKGQIPIGIHMLRILLLERLEEFSQRSLHELISISIKILRTRLNEPFKYRHPDLQTFYEKHLYRLLEIQALELNQMKHFFKASIQSKDFENVWEKLILFNAFFDAFDVETAKEICLLNQKWLLETIKKIPPHSPLDKELEEVNIILRLMKYNLLTEVTLEIHKPIYNHQARYVFNINTVPWGIRTLRNTLRKENQIIEEPLKVDDLFNTVLLELDKQKNAIDKKHYSFVIQEFYMTYEEKLRKLYDLAKSPERFFSEANPFF